MMYRTKEQLNIDKKSRKIPNKYFFLIICISASNKFRIKSKPLKSEHIQKQITKNAKQKSVENLKMRKSEQSIEFKIL